MSQEIRQTTTMRYRDGRNTPSRSFGGSLDVAGDGYTLSIQTAPLSGADADPLDLGSITTPGMLQVRNNSDYDLEFSTSTAHANVVAGCPAQGTAMFQLASTTPHVRSADATYTVSFEYFVIEA